MFFLLWAIAELVGSACLITWLIMDDDSPEAR